MTATVSADTYLPYTNPPIEQTIVNAGVTVVYPNGESADSIFCNGRLCVPFQKGIELMGAEVKQSGVDYRISLDDKYEFLSVDNNTNRPKLFSYGGVNYISLYELTAPFDYEIIVDLAANKVEILKDSPDLGNYNVSIGTESKSYIRLEDIVADGLKPDGKGNYSVDMVEKLKYTAEYLYLRNQQYYIAWIPVYADPAENYWNDVSKDYNLYNSYFLYVMDYMTEHNGHIGLHGYTHQYGNDVSGDGLEWGDKTPYSYYDQMRRMMSAKDVCRKLGYTEEFFEFPHYDATDAQLKMAEYYFDAVYQNYPSEKLKYSLTYTTRSGKKVYYIPTPAEYVYYKRDYSIFDRLEESFNNGYTISLFYHPKIDEEKFEAKSVDGKRVWTYSIDGSLPQIVNYVTNRGYAFSNWN
jgi:hypothetical protein